MSMPQFGELEDVLQALVERIEAVGNQLELLAEWPFDTSAAMDGAYVYARSGKYVGLRAVCFYRKDWEWSISNHGAPITSGSAPKLIDALAEATRAFAALHLQESLGTLRE